MFRCQPLTLRKSAVVFTLIAISGCRQESRDGSLDQEIDNPSAKPAAVLQFPQQLRVDDAEVNTFVEKMIRDCAGGDYDSFRLLWSAREQPLSRNEFEAGWQGIQRITVGSLEKVLLAPDPDETPGGPRTVYAVLMDVVLDPAHRPGKLDPQREVALMLIHEHGRWCLARAPKTMRAWIKDKAQPREGATVAETAHGVALDRAP